MQINLFLGIIILFVTMLVLPTLFLILFKNKRKTLKVLVIGSSVIYFILLIVGTTANIYLNGTNIFIESNSAGWFSMRFRFVNLATINILINLVLLFPIGYIVYFFTDKKPFIKTILISFIISVIIELYQWILPVARSTEICDIAFNTISGLLSALYCELLTKLGAFKS